MNIQIALREIFPEIPVSNSTFSADIEVKAIPFEMIHGIRDLGKGFPWKVARVDHDLLCSPGHIEIRKMRTGRLLQAHTVS